jgi:excisionase family DNA binding protein
MDRLLSVPEVATLLGVSRAQVYRYVGAGMPCVRLSNRVLRFRTSDLEHWVDEQLIERV